MDFAYPVTLTPDPDDGGYVVTFADLPEAITQGDAVEECLDEAQGALEAAIESRRSSASQSGPWSSGNRAGGNPRGRRGC